MNSTTNGKDLSEYLEGVVAAQLLKRKSALAVNALRTPELQEEVLDFYGDETRVIELIVRHVLDRESGKIIDQAIPQSADRGTPLRTAGPVIRDHISKAWEKGKKMSFTEWAVGLAVLSLLWNPFWSVIRAPFSWAHHLWRTDSAERGMRPRTGDVPTNTSQGTGRSAEEGSLNKEQPNSALRTPNSALSVPVPQITHASYTEGNKMVLRWNSVGAGYRYRIMRSYGKTDPTDPLIKDRTVDTPGAIINILAAGDTVAKLGVIAVSPEGQEGDISQPVQFNLKPWNNEDSIESLAITPTVEPIAQTHGSIPVRHAGESRAATRPVARVAGSVETRQPAAVKQTSLDSGLRHAGMTEKTQNTSTNQSETSKKPSFIHNFVHHVVGNADTLVTTAIPIAPLAEGINATKNAALSAHDETSTAKIPLNPPLPVPTGLQFQRVDDQWIRFTWNSLGPGYTYNYYSAIAGDPNSYEIENNTPVTTNQANWRPYDRTKNYWIAVTAVDSDRRESARSKPVEVDLR